MWIPGSRAESLDPFAETDDALGIGEVFEDIPEETSLRDDVTVTVSQDYAYGVSGPVDRTVVNRSSLRGEMGTSLGHGVFFRFDGKACVYWRRDHRTDTDDKSVDTDGDIREMYVQTENDRMSLKLGRQVVVWGETNGAVINDVVSPRDDREFLFTELKDARLGLVLATVSLYSDWGDLFSFVSLESRVNDLPDPGDRYAGIPEGAMIQDKSPGDSDREFGLKWRKAFHRFDVSLMAARLYQNSGVFGASMPGVFSREYPRYSFYGLGARYTVGNLLFNLDVSLKDGYGLQTWDTGGLYDIWTGKVTDSALGIEYDANGAYTVNLEIVYRHIPETITGIAGLEKSDTGVYLSWHRFFFHDTLSLELNGFYQLTWDDAVFQAKAEYDYTDHLTLSVDYTRIQAGNGDTPFSPFRDEDRVGAKIAYFF